MTAVVFERFEIVQNFDPTPLSTQSGEAITDRKGKYLRVDQTTGKAMLGNSSSAGEVGPLNGFAMSNQRNTGDRVSLFRHGLVDVGAALDSLSVGASVYLADTDSTFGTTAGTVSVVVGKVWPLIEADGSLKKLLYVDL